MTERKPPGVTWDTWIDQQIRAGIEQGAFDNLPGQGKPIADIDRPHDELWWVKQKLRSEEVQLLPPVLAVKKELEIAREGIERASSEAQVREIVAAINEKIRTVNMHATEGPPSDLMPLDEETVVARWSETHG